MVSETSLGALQYGGMEPEEDDSSLFFSVYHLEPGAHNTCTMVFGRLVLDTATIAWQKQSEVQSSSEWCLIPKDVHLYNSSFVYFSATFASHAGVFRAHTDGSGIELFTGFAFSGGRTFLFSYIYKGGYAYAQGVSDNPAFTISGRAATYVVKNLLDFGDTSCSSLAVISFAVSFTASAATVRD